MGIEEQDGCCETITPSSEKIKQIVKKKYGRIAVEGGSCGCAPGCCGDETQDPIQISATLGYTKEELGIVPQANLGLGCGNPGALGCIKEGQTVLDLGSGAGMDAFLAANRVGKSGKVIGIDFTEKMVKKARQNAKSNGFSNVEFKLGDIEDLPIPNNSIDVVLSNCVINLVPDKSKAFSEAYRVLRPGGSMYISDMVLLKELTEEQRADEDLISGCVGGAILKDEYLGHIVSAGFQMKKITEDKKISKRQYKGLPVESVKIVATKPVTSIAKID
jgi:ArsR family transcriptional regulator